MSPKHTGLITTASDNAVVKLAAVNNNNDGLVMVPIAPTFTIVHTQLGVEALTDDIQTLSLSPAASDGTWSLVIQGQKITFLGRSATATQLDNAITAKGITDVIVAGGPLGVMDITFTRVEKLMDLVKVEDNTLIITPLKWAPLARLVKFYEVISSSLYSTTPLWNQQAVYTSGNPGSGTITLTIAGQTTIQLPFNCTAIQFQTGMNAITNLNPANYEVFGGPWPKAIVLKFKNELQYQSVNRLVLGVNSFDRGQPVIYPIGKQILVSRHAELGKYIVIRPGYI